jgi:hypothetical protein
MNPQPTPQSSVDVPLAAEEAAMSLDDVLSREPMEFARPSTLAKPTWPLPAVIVGSVTGIREDGIPLVDFDGNETGRPLAARSTANVDSTAVGREVAMLFEGGDLARPIILGMIHRAEGPSTAADSSDESKGAVLSANRGSSEIEAISDGQRVTISADKEIELRCGKASITLTRAGKVIIRGAYLLSRSSGVNRIKGGSVQIN